MKTKRIETSALYSKVFRRGIACRGKFFEIRILASRMTSQQEDYFANLGVICGRKIGSSVTRNLNKRRARSYISDWIKLNSFFLRNQKLVIVCICISDSSNSSWREVCDDFMILLRTIFSKIKTNSFSDSHESNEKQVVKISPKTKN